MAWTLVTGGAKRLGADISLALAQAGYDVVIHYNHSEQEAIEVAAQCRQMGVQSATIQGDFSSMHSTLDFLHRYLNQFPDTANVVNNVGNYLIQSALQTSLEEWLDLFQINVHTPFALMKALSPSLIRYKGNIVNIGVSGLERARANTYATAYHLTKQCLYQLTRSCAKEWAPHGVRANMVSPGYLNIAVDLPQDLSKLPMHRAAQSQEVSRVVLFLIDPQSAYITGQNIEVAGGVGL